MTIEITGRRYYDAQGRELDFPVGNTGDLMTCEHDITVKFKVELGNILVKIDGDQVTMIGGEWWDYGFVAGDTVVFDIITVDAIPFSASLVVDFIDAEVMYVVSSGFGMGTFNTGTISTDKNPEAFEVYFNLVRNTSAGSAASLIDGQVQKFKADINGLAVGATVVFDQLGARSGGSTMEMEITRNADPSEGRSYTIETSFIWWNLNQPELFTADECVTPWFKFIALPQFNNPALSAERIYKPTGEGNSGFRNENYNGGQQQYTFNSVSWSVPSGVAQTQDWSQPSTFVAIVNSIDSLFTANSKFNVGWFYNTTDESLYKSTNSVPINTPIDVNLMLLTDSGVMSVGTPSDVAGRTNSFGAGMDLSDITISQTGATATITGTLTPNADFINFMQGREGDRGFVLWIKCDQSIAEQPELNFSPMVNVEMASGQMEKAPVILGEWEEIEKATAFDHFDEEIVDPVITEDDILAVIQFRLPTFNNFTGVTGKIVAKNGSNTFTLDEVNVPFLPYPTLPDGSIPVNFQNNRLFRLPPSSDKRFARLVRDPSLDIPDFFGLEFKYPFLVRWEYWLTQLNASNDFYGDTGEGKNKDWQHYQDLGWSLQILFEVNTPDGDYQNFYPLSVEPYDSDPHLTDTLIEFFRSDGTPVNVPIQGEIMDMKVTHTMDVTPTGFKWGDFTVEPFEGAPRWLLSTYLDWGNDSANPLFPLEGETKIKVTTVGMTVIYEFRYDTNKIDGSNGVSFTSEIKTEGGDFLVFNRFKSQPIKSAILPQPFTPQNRGDLGCCDCSPQLKLASTTQTGRYYNDLTGAIVLSDPTGEVSFTLVNNGEEIEPIGVQCVFNNGQDVYAFVINWREHLIANGAGCYHLMVNYDIAGITGSYEYGEYELIPWSIENASGTVRIYSVFDDLNRKMQVDFTASGFVDSVRVRGMFGWMKPNAEIRNLVSSEYIRRKVRNQHLKTYELRIEPTTECVTSDIIDNHLLGANEIYICDHNVSNHSYKYNDFPVILSEGTTPEMEYFEGSRLATIKATFSDKGAFDEAHFAGSLKPGINAGFILSQGGTIPPTVITVQVVNSEGTVIATGEVSESENEIVVPDTTATVKHYGDTEGTPFTYATGGDLEINIS